MVVPGHLLAGRAVAQLDDAGRLGTTLADWAHARLALDLEAGRWHLVPEASGEVELVVHDEGRRHASSGFRTGRVSRRRAGRWSCRCGPLAARAHVRRLVLSRDGETTAGASP